METLIKRDSDDRMIVKRVSVPTGLEELMEGLTKEVLLKKPKDLYQFASEYFSQLVLLREKSHKYKVHPVRSAQSITKVKAPTVLPVKNSSPPKPIKHFSHQLSIRSRSPKIKSKLEEKKLAPSLNREKNRSKERNESQTKKETPRNRSISSKRKSESSTNPSSVQSTPRDKRQTSVPKKVKAVDDKKEDKDFKLSRTKKKDYKDKLKDGLVITSTAVAASSAGASVKTIIANESKKQKDHDEIKSIHKEKDSNINAGSKDNYQIKKTTDILDVSSTAISQNYSSKTEKDKTIKDTNKNSMNHTETLESDILNKSTKENNNSNEYKVIIEDNKQDKLMSVEETNIAPSHNNLSQSEEQKTIEESITIETELKEKEEKLNSDRLFKSTEDKSNRIEDKLTDNSPTIEDSKEEEPDKNRSKEEIGILSDNKEKSKNETVPLTVQNKETNESMRDNIEEEQDKETKKEINNNKSLSSDHIIKEDSSIPKKLIVEEADLAKQAIVDHTAKMDTSKIIEAVDISNKNEDPKIKKVNSHKELSILEENIETNNGNDFKESVDKKDITNEFKEGYTKLEKENNKHQSKPDEIVKSNENQTKTAVNVNQENISTNDKIQISDDYKRENSDFVEETKTDTDNVDLKDNKENTINTVDTSTAKGEKTDISGLSRDIFLENVGDSNLKDRNIDIKKNIKNIKIDSNALTTFLDSEKKDVFKHEINLENPITVEQDNEIKPKANLPELRAHVSSEVPKDNKYAHDIKESTIEDISADTKSSKIIVKENIQDKREKDLTHNGCSDVEKGKSSNKDINIVNTVEINENNVNNIQENDNQNNSTKVETENNNQNIEDVFNNEVKTLSEIDKVSNPDLQNSRVVNNTFNTKTFTDTTNKGISSKTSVQLKGENELPVKTGPNSVNNDIASAIDLKKNIEESSKINDAKLEKEKISDNVINSYTSQENGMMITNKDDAEKFSDNIESSNNDLKSRDKKDINTFLTDIRDSIKKGDGKKGSGKDNLGPVSLAVAGATTVAVAAVTPILTESLDNSLDNIKNKTKGKETFSISESTKENKDSEKVPEVSTKLSALKTDYNKDDISDSDILAKATNIAILSDDINKVNELDSTDSENSIKKVPLTDFKSENTLINAKEENLKDDKADDSKIWAKSSNLDIVSKNIQSNLNESNNDVDQKMGDNKNNEFENSKQIIVSSDMEKLSKDQDLNNINDNPEDSENNKNNKTENIAQDIKGSIKEMQNSQDGDNIKKDYEQQKSTIMKDGIENIIKDNKTAVDNNGQIELKENLKHDLNIIKKSLQEENKHDLNKKLRPSDISSKVDDGLKENIENDNSTNEIDNVNELKDNIKNGDLKLTSQDIIAENIKQVTIKSNKTGDKELLLKDLETSKKVKNEMKENNTERDKTVEEEGQNDINKNVDETTNNYEILQKTDQLEDQKNMTEPEEVPSVENKETGLPQNISTSEQLVDDKKTENKVEDQDGDDILTVSFPTSSAEPVVEMHQAQTIAKHNIENLKRDSFSDKDKVKSNVSDDEQVASEPGSDIMKTSPYRNATKKILESKLSEDYPGIVDSEVKKFLSWFIKTEQDHVFQMDSVDYESPFHKPENVTKVKQESELDNTNISHNITYPEEGERNLEISNTESLNIKPKNISNAKDELKKQEKQAVEQNVENNRDYKIINKANSIIEQTEPQIMERNKRDTNNVNVSDINDFIKYNNDILSQNAVLKKEPIKEEVKDEKLEKYNESTEQQVKPELSKNETSKTEQLPLQHDKKCSDNKKDTDIYSSIESENNTALKNNDLPENTAHVIDNIECKEQVLNQDISTEYSKSCDQEINNTKVTKSDKLKDKTESLDQQINHYQNNKIIDIENSTTVQSELCHLENIKTDSGDKEAVNHTNIPTTSENNTALRNIESHKIKSPIKYGTELIKENEPELKQKLYTVENIDHSSNEFNENHENEGQKKYLLEESKTIAKQQVDSKNNELLQEEENSVRKIDSRKEKTNIISISNPENQTAFQNEDSIKNIDVTHNNVKKNELKENVSTVESSTPTHSEFKELNKNKDQVNSRLKEEGTTGLQTMHSQENKLVRNENFVTVQPQPQHSEISKIDNTNISKTKTEYNSLSQEEHLVKDDPLGKNNINTKEKADMKPETSYTEHNKESDGTVSQFVNKNLKDNKEEVKYTEDSVKVEETESSLQNSDSVEIKPLVKNKDEKETSLPESEKQLLHEKEIKLLSADIPNNIEIPHLKLQDDEKELKHTNVSGDIIKSIANLELSSEKPGIIDNSIKNYLNSFIHQEKYDILKPKEINDGTIEKGQNKFSEEKSTKNEKQIKDDKKEKKERSFKKRFERSLSQTTSSEDEKISPRENKIKRTQSVGVLKSDRSQPTTSIPMSARQRSKEKTTRKSAGRRPLIRQLETTSKELEEKILGKKETEESSSEKSDKENVSRKSREKREKNSREQKTENNKNKIYLEGAKISEPLQDSFDHKQGKTDSKQSKTDTQIINEFEEKQNKVLKGVDDEQNGLYKLKNKDKNKTIVEVNNKNHKVDLASEPFVIESANNDYMMLGSIGIDNDINIPKDKDTIMQQNQEKIHNEDNEERTSKNKKESENKIKPEENDKNYKDTNNVKTEYLHNYKIDLLNQEKSRANGKVEKKLKEEFAVKIQSMWRGFITRKNLKESQKQRKSTNLSTEQAIIKIQSFVRGYIDRQKVNKHKKVMQTPPKEIKATASKNSKDNTLPKKPDFYRSNTVIEPHIIKKNIPQLHTSSESSNERLIYEETVDNNNNQSKDETDLERDTKSAVHKIIRGYSETALMTPMEQEVSKTIRKIMDTGIEQEATEEKSNNLSSSCTGKSMKNIEEAISKLPIVPSHDIPNSIQEVDKIPEKNDKDMSKDSENYSSEETHTLTEGSAKLQLILNDEPEKSYDDTLTESDDIKSIKTSFDDNTDNSKMFPKIDVELLNKKSLDKVNKHLTQITKAESDENSSENKSISNEYPDKFDTLQDISTSMDSSKTDDGDTNNIIETVNKPDNDEEDVFKNDYVTEANDIKSKDDNILETNKSTAETKLELKNTADHKVSRFAISNSGEKILDLKLEDDISSKTDNITKNDTDLKNQPELDKLPSEMHFEELRRTKGVTEEKDNEFNFDTLAVGAKHNRNTLKDKTESSKDVKEDTSKISNIMQNKDQNEPVSCNSKVNDQGTNKDFVTETDKKREEPNIISKINNVNLNESNKETLISSNKDSISDDTEANKIITKENDRQLLNDETKENEDENKKGSTILNENETRFEGKENTSKKLDIKIDERPDDLSSVDSADSVVTVIENPNHESKDVNEQVETKTNKNISNKNMSDALEGHVDLIDQVQNTLLDQICGKQVDTSKKFDIEQLRQELQEAASLYHENESTQTTHNDELLHYLSDFEPEENMFDSKRIRSPNRELPDIAEERETESRDSEDNKDAVKFCGNPSLSSENLKAGRPKSEVEVLSPDEISNLEDNNHSTTYKVAEQTTPSIEVKSLNEKPSTKDVETQMLQHSSEFHDTVVVPLPLNNERLDVVAGMTSGQDAAGPQRPESTDRDNQTAIQQAPGVAEQTTPSIEVKSLNEKPPTKDVETHMLQHSSEFHDTVVVPLPLNNERLDVVAGMTSGQDAAEPQRPESTDRGNQTAIQQAPGPENLTPPPLSSSPRSSFEAQPPLKTRQDSQGGHRSPPPQSRTRTLQQQDMDGENSSSNNNSKKNNAVSNSAIGSTEKQMEVEAATKIQAGFRGYQVRKQLKSKKTTADKTNPKKPLRRKNSSGDNKKDDLEEKSAVKIQAGVRGFLVRRRQKKQTN
ncbi:uncharacterized protein PF11_0213-like [Sitophilus oryzae]|uniref:Uncharacterized protein PF11_0213-like n=1 Tax=Sitophilus oryzae TaxID=7048 RepID=A0A6J2YI42_SITOR|nr:uncharacterized protein PF11_0213-like [Sitophilus oryzae]